MFIVGSTFAVRDRPPRFDVQRAGRFGSDRAQPLSGFAGVRSWVLSVAVFRLIWVPQN